MQQTGTLGEWMSSKVQNQSQGTKPKGQALIVQTALLANPPQRDTEVWYLDSGATDHMSNQETWFINLKLFSQSQTVNVGKKGGTVSALGSGDINILAFNGNRWVEKHLSQVLFVPELRYNLFSAGSALDKGLLQFSDAKGCCFKHDGTVVAVGVREHKLCEMLFKAFKPTSDEIEANLATKGSLKSWYEKLAHQNICHVKKYLKTRRIYVDDKEDFFAKVVFMVSHTDFLSQNANQRIVGPKLLVNSSMQTCVDPCK